MTRSRRLFLRYASLFVIILIFSAWIRGWFVTSNANDVIQSDFIYKVLPAKRHHGWSLPVVYMDKDISNKTSLVSSQTRIPRVIHQTWKSNSIPSKFVPLVKSWLRVNPDYEYWFWTDADADRFVKSYYPEYYDLFRSYPQNIMRADAIRYFILYHFGGWYADMDIEAIKPIDTFSRSHQCLISQEPWAHTKFFWNKNRLACNALMAARPGHLFFDLVIKELPNASKRSGKDDVMSRTGPKFVDTTVSLYEKMYAKDYNKSMALYLAGPDVFLPTVAANALALIKKGCEKKQSDLEKQKICDQFKARNFRNEVPKDSYTNHVWVHTYYGIDEKHNEDIFKLIPNAKSVKNILDTLEKDAKQRAQPDKSSVDDMKKLGHGF